VLSLASGFLRSHAAVACSRHGTTTAGIPPGLRFVDGADREHVLWDGKHKRKVLAARITKEQAVEHLMEHAYEDSTIPF
jgi:hypothetical protein